MDLFVGLEEAADQLVVGHGIRAMHLILASDSMKVSGVGLRVWAEGLRFRIEGFGLRLSG